MSTSDVDQLVFVPRGRPVLRFVSVLTGIAIVATAVWWAGLAAARVDLSIDSRFDAASNSGAALVTMHNRAPLEAWVSEVGVAPDSHGRSYVRLIARDRDGVLHLRGGTRQRVTITYTVD